MRKYSIIILTLVSIAFSQVDLIPPAENYMGNNGQLPGDLEYENYNELCAQVLYAQQVNKTAYRISRKPVLEHFEPDASIGSDIPVTITMRDGFIIRNRLIGGIYGDCLNLENPDGTISNIFLECIQTIKIDVVLDCNSQRDCKLKRFISTIVGSIFTKDNKPTINIGYLTNSEKAKLLEELFLLGPMVAYSN